MRTAEGERVIGSWAAGSPEEALAFFRRKFDALEAEVALAEHRIATTGISTSQAQTLSTLIIEADAIGDLDGLRARLEMALKEASLKAGRTPKTKQAKSGWESLTATEVKIAAFVENGLSNPEIAARLSLSRRTVATHVSHILRKLDVTSRTDIARESALRAITDRSW